MIIACDYSFTPNNANGSPLKSYLTTVVNYHFVIKRHRSPFLQKTNIIYQLIKSVPQFQANQNDSSIIGN